MSEHCEHARELASAELDGGLSDFEQALLDAHLKRCAACTGFRGSVARITRELRSAPLERLEQPVEIRRPMRRIPFRLAPAAAALAIVAVGLGSVLTSLNLREVAGRPAGESSSPTASAADARGLNNLMRLHERVAQREVQRQGLSLVRPNTLGGPVVGPLPPAVGDRP